MATWLMPMTIAQNYYGSGTVVPRITGVLLPNGATIPTTARNMVDVNSLEISTSGGYIKTNGYWSATTAMQFPDFQAVADEANGRTEIGPTSTIFSSTNAVTITFRYIVFCTDNKIINIADYGGNQSLQEQPLVCSLSASPVTASSWPIQTFYRTS